MAVARQQGNQGKEIWLKPALTKPPCLYQLIYSEADNRLNTTLLHGQ